MSHTPDKGAMSVNKCHGGELHYSCREVVAERDTYRDLCGELLEALRAANQFIGNGIELGYIRMPDRDTPDAAHKTPAIVRSAITKAEKIMGDISHPKNPNVR